MNKQITAMMEKHASRRTWARVLGMSHTGLAKAIKNNTLPNDKRRLILNALLLVNEALNEKVMRLSKEAKRDGFRI